MCKGPTVVVLLVRECTGRRQHPETGCGRWAFLEATLRWAHLEPVGNLTVMDTELRRLREILKAMLEERDLSVDVFELVSDARESLGKALSIVREELGD